MPENHTPAQAAYAAYCLFWCNQGLGERALLAWSTLTPEMHAAWEAAAQAVRAREERDVDMLTALKDGDSHGWTAHAVLGGSCFFDTAHGGTWLGFRTCSPLSGILRLAKATPYPRRSHIVSTGFTSPMP